MPIKGLEYEINEWDGLAKGVAPTRVVRVAPTAARTTTPTTATTVVNAPKPTPVPARPPTVAVQSRIMGIPVSHEFVMWLDGIYVKLKSLVTTGKLGQTYKTNQWDGTISDLERGR